MENKGFKRVNGFLLYALAVLMMGVMVATAMTPMTTHAAENEGREIHVQSIIATEEVIQELLDLGFTVIIMEGSAVIQRIEPGAQNVQFLTREDTLIHNVPQLSAPRVHAESNGALHDAILAWLRANRTTEHLGQLGLPHQTAPEGIRLGQELMEIIREVAPTDPLFANTLGKNERGMEVFFDSFSIEFSTANNRNVGGLFHATVRTIEIPKNITSGDRVVSFQTPEQNARVVIYEIGRARGWEEIMSRLFADEASSVDLSRHGLRWDPSLERAVSHAAGGIHMIFEAADSLNVDGFMNENISRANPHFTFTNQQWRMARTVEDILRNPQNIDPLAPPGTARALSTAVRGRNINVNQLQTDIRRATDHNLPVEQRQFANVSEADRRAAALRVNQVVGVLAQIGIDNEITVIGAHLMHMDWRPSVDPNTLEYRTDATASMGQVEIINPTIPYEEPPTEIPPQETQQPPAIPHTPATAFPSAASIMVNGTPVAFRAFNIGGHTFFMLRDIAYALNGTAGQFDVNWDGSLNAINLSPGAAYAPTGSEMAAAATLPLQAMPSTARIYINALPATLRAYTIDGNNFFRLRDLGDALGFGVYWDSSTASILIVA